MKEHHFYSNKILVFGVADTDKTFWLHPKGAALNELTGFRMNASNLLQFIEIADTSGTYLIKSKGNGKCLRSQG